MSKGKRSEGQKQVEKMYLRIMTREEAAMKLIDISGMSRYFPAHEHWVEALVLGENALMRVEEHEEIAEDICDNICRWREQAFMENKDPDDAERWLLENHCNADCPVNRLME